MKTILFALMAGALLLPALCRAEEAAVDVNVLVKDLGAADFNQREAAVKRLQALGLKAQPALKAAAETGDPEVKKRASDLLVYLDNIETVSLLDHNEYYPLRLGSTWEYSAGIVSLINKVDGYEKIGENYCAKLVTYNNGQPVANEHVTVKKDGVYRCASAGNAIAPPVKIVSLPAKAGDEWKVNSVIQGLTLTGTSKLGEEKGVEVMGGTFDVVTISSDDLKVATMAMSQKMYLAKNVGMIKQEVTLNGNPVKLELVKYTAGEAHAAAPAPSAVGEVGQPGEKKTETAPPMTGSGK